MARVTLLIVLALVALHVVALIDCLSTRPDRIAAFPRRAWLALIVLCPVAGPIAWFRAGTEAGPRPDREPGRRAQARRALAQRERARARRGPIGPEDDADFVRFLAESVRNR
ncbi:PLD nuclease N-terminal domain-containing protein [Actinoplanes sp. NBRC 101535]|uniref:PLD nuclease N-terminal domain-containing protein n=1 Tax=Actinoplanes sp. NBRC 101535 TaxID=3032196 RepID=UPI0025562177|nr:PLD nuclease N-terminal domain-containing protein [Actinoplanes sp. NBRC 101535]